MAGVQPGWTTPKSGTFPAGRPILEAQSAGNIFDRGRRPRADEEGEHGYPREGLAPQNFVGIAACRLPKGHLVTKFLNEPMPTATFPYRRRNKAGGPAETLFGLWVFPEGTIRRTAFRIIADQSFEKPAASAVLPDMGFQEP